MTNDERPLRVLAIQHIACEPPGAYGDELLARGADLTCVEIDAGEPLPPLRRFDAVIAMGGPMNVDDEAQCPWLVQEKRAIGEAVRAGQPFWGVCLGAQLLAAALGATVHAGGAPEVGIYGDVTPTADARRDPVFAAAPERVTTLQWHDDMLDLPAGAILLASSPACRSQAFAWGRAYGLQFHLEVSPELAAQWADVPAYANSLEAALGPGALARLVEQLQREADAMQRLARELLGRWLDHVVAPTARRGVAS